LLGCFSELDTRSAIGPLDFEPGGLFVVAKRGVSIDLCEGADSGFLA
jgi:hypothetical protein